MSNQNKAMRTEHDALGQVAVPAEAHWGAQTQRSLLHFPFGEREAMPAEIVRALAMVKLAAARVNRAELPADLGKAIEQAAGEVVAGDHADQFPLAIWQTGSGTQTNMNVNEVIASRANELLTGQRGGKQPVHPNDHVNRHQSSNDSFPTALHLAVALAATGRLIPAVDGMIAQLDQLAQSHPVRNADHGLRPGDRQSSGSRCRRDAGPVAAERVQAADRRRSAAFDRPAGHRQ